MNLIGSSFILPCLIKLLYAASTPEHVAAEFSNALWKNGVFQAVYGNTEGETSKQPVALTTTTGIFSAAIRVCLATTPAPQPAQSL